MISRIGSLFRIVMLSFFASCGGGDHQEKGLKLPAEGLFFEVDEKDHHTLKGHNQSLDIELGKLTLGSVLVTLKSDAEIVGSGNLTELNPMPFTFDGVGYKLSMTGSDYNLIAASVVKLKVEAFTSLNPQELVSYRASPEFEADIKSKFDAGYAFDVVQRSGISISVGKATMNVRVGDISAGSASVSVDLDNESIHQTVLKPNQTTIFNVGKVALSLTCLKYVDEVMDLGYFSIQTATPEMIQQAAQNGEAGMSSVSDVSDDTHQTPHVAATGFAVPEQGMNIEINQRSSKNLTGKKKVFTIAIGDITKGQTTINLMENDRPILGETISEGTKFSFLFEGKNYTIECVDLINDLVGEDQGIFVVKNK